jgi:hypothetical protein
MTFINATLWNDLQPTDATNEKRFAELGLVDAVKESTPATAEYIPPSGRERMASLSSLRNIDIPVIKDQQVVVNQSPGFSIPANLEETDTYFFQPYNVFSGFRHYPAAYDNNQLDQEFAIREKMKNIAYAMGNEMESVLSTVIETRKTQLLDYTAQVSTGTGTYAFDAGTDTLEVDLAAQNETMFYSLSELMEANELGGSYRIVTSRAGMARQMGEMLKYGPNNEKNLAALGFLGMDRIHQTKNISVGSDIFNGYFMRDGSIGMYENFPTDFRAGTRFAGKEWSISDMELPFCRMRANIFTNNEATDATALITSGTDSNLQMTHFEEMAVWLRFYVVYRYNSDLTTRANDIVKIKGLTT